jgi:hypothetical protein
LLLFVIFSEKCFIVQLEVEDFNWTNVEAALHPFVAYYSQHKMTEDISYVVVADCKYLKYDTVAVRLLQSKLCSSLSAKMKDLTNNSDGAALRYEGRNLMS